MSARIPYIVRLIVTTEQVLEVDAVSLAEAEQEAKQQAELHGMEVIRVESVNPL